MSAPVQIAPEWWMAVSAGGHSYYHNTTTNETTWVAPMFSTDGYLVDVSAATDWAEDRMPHCDIDELRDEIMDLIMEQRDLQQQLQQHQQQQQRQEALLQEQAIALRVQREEAAAAAAAEIASLRSRMFNVGTGRSSWV